MAFQPESSPPSPQPPALPPELLAPAGDWDCVRAAVQNGANAIYFGLSRFNARMRAKNFTEADLPELMAYLHERGVRGYVTFNTLIFENELAEATDYLQAIIRAGVDAAIVQDIGICRLIRQFSPDFPIHASTQMTVSCARGIAFARNLGCNLVVLARECSLREITAIHQAQLHPPASPASTPPPMPLEVFVHGALCVAYSGQCLTSESLGGRSANRGECAQACRMPYDLLCDGQPVPLGDRRYLLSPQDLAGLELLPAILKTGVSSLKIEGRLKTPEYVASITRLYRAAIDQATGTPPPAAPDTPESRRYEMEMAFSRGLHTGWFEGINNQRLVHAQFGKKRGVLVGTVHQVNPTRQTVLITPHAPLKPGDGVVFDNGHPDQPEEGGRVYTVHTDGRFTALSFGRDDLRLDRIHTGDRLWKTSDPELERQLRRSFEADAPRFPLPLRLQVLGEAGAPLTVIARDQEGTVVQTTSETPLEHAINQPLTRERLQEQLGRLGGTPFKLSHLDCNLTGNLILPIRELNQIRRNLVEKLITQRRTPRRWTLNEPHPSPPPPAPVPPADPELIVLVRTLPQLEAALEQGVHTLYCEWEDPKRYPEIVRLTRQAFGTSPGTRSVWVTPPRIHKEGEDWILNQVLKAEADGYLVRNFAHLDFFRSHRRRGDFSLNVANHLTASWFIQDQGLERVTASYDLNITQLVALLQGAPPTWFEITLHQHMPMFHMEHCVFCAFLTKGTDFTNCGRPCDRHDVRLRDRVGASHPVKADAGCRNTVYNALAQTGAEFQAHLASLGARHFRIDFLDESPEQVRTTLDLYRQLLRGACDGATLWRTLRAQRQLGVTRGQLAG